MTILQTAQTKRKRMWQRRARTLLRCRIIKQEKKLRSLEKAAKRMQMRPQVPRIKTNYV